MSPSATPSLQDVIQWVDAEAGDRQPLDRLQAASVLVRDLSEIGDAVLGYFVDQARHSGHSWSEIGEALGVSKQAAQQKHTVRMSVGPNAPTFERFTPRARNVVSAAEPIARSWGHGHVGTEHLLLALYREPHGVAAQILVESNLPPDKADAAVRSRVERGSGAPEGKLAFTPGAIEGFTGALASALEMGHNYIGTEHLLLGLARGDGLAAEVLEEFGLTQETLTAKTIGKLAGYLAGLGEAEPSTRRQAAKASAPKRRSAPRKKAQ